MSRTHLLGAVSAAALACFSTGAFAQESTTAITGGGSTLAEFDYFNEFTTFNNGQKAGAPTFNNNVPGAAGTPVTGNDALYWPAGSGAGQAGLLNDDLSCDANKVTGNNGGNCSGTVGGANTVDYGASDATLNGTQVAQWNSSTVGQSAAGNLIQIPSMGVGISFPIVDGGFTANGGVALTDSDLCGIFSGKLTNWNQTSVAGQIADGTINVVYRNDGSGTSFLLLNHFRAVCTASNSSFPTLPVVPSTTFTNVFVTQANPTGTPPSNFTGEKGSSGIANYLSGLIPPAPTSAIAYLSPDFTTIDPNSNAVLSNGSKSALNVAAVLNGTTAELPTEANILLGLNNPNKNARGAAYLTPPAAPAGYGPTTVNGDGTLGAGAASDLVSLIPATLKGYPVVGYTTFDFAQCYATAAIGKAISTFIKKDHYSTTNAFATSEVNNGFVPLAKSGAKKFVAALNTNIFGTNGTSIQGSGCTAGKGR